VSIEGLHYTVMPLREILVLWSSQSHSFAVNIETEWRAVGFVLLCCPAAIGYYWWSWNFKSKVDCTASEEIFTVGSESSLQTIGVTVD